MFCSKCGTQVNDGVRFCTNCGADLAPTTEINQAQPTVQYGYVQPKKPFFANKGLLIIIGSAALAVIVALVLIFTLAGSSGAKTPEAAATKFVEATYGKDVDKLISVMSQYTKNEIMEYSDGSQATDKQVKQALQYQLSRYNYQNDIELMNVVVKDVEMADYYELEDYIDEYTEKGGYGFRTNENITAFAKVEITIIVKQDGRVEEEYGYFDCCCIDKKWYVVTF